MNRQLNNDNEIASLKKFIPDIKSKDLKSEQAQAINLVIKNSSCINRTNNVDYTDWKWRRNSHTVTTTN